jgi:hypothetical protein
MGHTQGSMLLRIRQSYSKKGESLPHLSECGGLTGLSERTVIVIEVVIYLLGVAENILASFRHCTQRG